MKTEKWVSSGISVALAFLLSFGGAGCLISAFSLDVNMASLALGCILIAIGGGLCYLHRRGDAIAASILALVLGYLWRRGALVSGFETLAYELSLRYDGGYGWGTIGQRGGSVTTALLLLAADVSLSTTRSVNRQGSAFPVLTIALLPLMLCTVVTDTVPGEGYLGLLLFGMLLLLLTQSLRKNDHRQANILTAMVALPLALGLGLLFLAVPQDDYVNHAEDWSQELVQWVSEIPERWQEITDVDASVVDTQEESVDLTEQGPKKQYTYTVMTVTAPTTGTLYLRGQDFDVYTGTDWSSTESRKELFAEENTVDWHSAGTVDIRTRRVQSLLYYPYYTGKGQFLLEGGCVANGDGTSSYSLFQYALPPDWETGLSALPDQNVSALSRYRTLPEDTQSWAQPLVQSILTTETTDTEIAHAIGNYVRSCAAYDLNTPKMDEAYEDFAQWFLTESDTGYCVHFATAATVLLRAAGVEARYVTGYMVSVQAGVETTVTADRGHAWVEYYESRLGIWMVLEATPGMEGAGQPGQESSRATEDTEASEGTAPQQTPSTQPGQATEDTGAQQTRPQEPTEQDSQTDDAESAGGSWLWILLALLLVSAAVVGQMELRRGLRRRQLRQAAPNPRALALWQQVCLLARLLKLPIPEELEALAQKARYSQHTLTPQELTVFEGWIREAKRQFRDRPLYWKLLMNILFAI